MSLRNLLISILIVTSAFSLLVHSQSSDQLLQILLGADVQARESALKSIVALDADARSALATSLATAMKTSGPEKRNLAEYCLELMDFSAAPALEKLAVDASPDTQIAAILILGRIAIRNSAAHPITELVLALARALHDPNAGVRFAATLALSDVGNPAVDAAPTLQGALHDSDDRVRLQAAVCLAKMKLANGESVGVLIEFLANSDPSMRQIAALALGWSGPQAKIAADQLVKALKASDELTRLSAAESLAELDPANSSGAIVLANLLASKNPGVRSTAARTLQRLGPAASNAAPMLGDALQSQDETLRYAALFALAAIGPAAGDQVPKIAALLDHATGYFPASILNTLSRIGTPEALKVIEDYRRRTGKL